MGSTVLQSIDSIRINGMHRFCRCWTITRTDAVVYRFTDHNAALVIDGNTFSPVDSISLTARQKTEGVSPQNSSAAGVISSNLIKDSDLRAGKFYNAKIVEQTFDWLVPWTGALQTQTYYLNEASFSREVWQADLMGLAMKLKRSVGRLLTRGCQWHYGDSRCTSVPLTYDGTVSFVSESRRAFESDIVIPEDDWLDVGKVTWTKGANIGLVHDIRGSLKNNGAIALHLKTPFDIIATDTFTAQTGCNGTKKQCKNKYHNVINHGGFPDLVGTDNALANPGL